MTRSETRGTVRNLRGPFEENPGHVTDKEDGPHEEGVHRGVKQRTFKYAVSTKVNPPEVRVKI